MITKKLEESLVEILEKAEQEASEKRAMLWQSPVPKSVFAILAYMALIESTAKYNLSLAVQTKSSIESSIDRYKQDHPLARFIAPNESSREYLNKDAQRMQGFIDIFSKITEQIARTGALFNVSWQIGACFKGIYFITLNTPIGKRHKLLRGNESGVRKRFNACEPAVAAYVNSRMGEDYLPDGLYINLITYKGKSNK